MKKQLCSLTVLVLVLTGVFLGCGGYGSQSGGGGSKTTGGAPGFLVFPDLTIRTKAQGPPAQGLYLEGSIVPGERLGGGDGFMPRGNILGTGDLTPGGHDFLTFPSLRIVGEHAGEEILTPNLRGVSQGDDFNPTTRQVEY